MTSAPSFDVEAAHRYYSVHCFNAAWDLLDKEERTPLVSASSGTYTRRW